MHSEKMIWLNDWWVGGQYWKKATFGIAVAITTTMETSYEGSIFLLAKMNF